jgi:DNA-binding IclR family transcriptional regulator
MLFLLLGYKNNSDGGTMQDTTKLAGLRRGIQVIERLAGEPSGCSFRTVQKALGNLSAPTLSRLLKVLVETGWVRKDPESGWYGIGRGFVPVADAVIGNLPREIRIQPIVDTLARRTGESAAFFEIDDDDLVLLAKSEQMNSVHYRNAHERNRALVRNAFAKTMLSRMAHERQVHYYQCADSNEGMTQKTFFARLKRIAQETVWTDAGEHQPGVIRLIAPVRMETESGVGAIGISLPARELREDQRDRLQQAVAEAAQQAEQALKNPEKPKKGKQP